MDRLRASYLVVRRWVDRELADRPSSKLPLLPLILLSLAAGLASHAFASPLLFGGAALWTIFIAWRGYRLMRVVGIRGDRKFDRDDKYKLPPEYVSSESVLSANRRRRRARQK